MSRGQKLRWQFSAFLGFRAFEGSFVIWIGSERSSVVQELPVEEIGDAEGGESLRTEGKLLFTELE